jgi:hypothetical protein
MSSVTRLDTEKLRTRRIIATAALTVVAIAFLLLRDASADPTESNTVETASIDRSVRPQEE